MEKSKKICVLTWYDSLNYGTCLQAYSLVNFLIAQGYDAYIFEKIKCYYGIKHPFHTIKKVWEKLYLKMRSLSKIIADNHIPEEIRNAYKIRRMKNKEFAYNYCNVIVTKRNKEYKEILNATNIFITGSDQIWNPNYINPLYLLSFVNNKKKIAYGSSIGVVNIPLKKIILYKRYLSKFNNIGVREVSAKIALEKIIEKQKIELVLDPTFLLTKKMWKSLITHNSKTNTEDSYIFCYFIGENTTWQKNARELSNYYNIPVYCALGESNILPHYGKILSDIGVQEFVKYLMDAEFILTDSFHAVALSINFNKQFGVYKRFKDNDKNSQNSRITDLLTMFECGDRLIDGEDFDINFFETTINYEPINKIKSILRCKSIEFLINAIEEE